MEKVGQYLLNNATIEEFVYNAPAAIWTYQNGNVVTGDPALGFSYMVSNVNGIKKITVGEGVQYVGRYFIYNLKDCDLTVYFPDGMNITAGYIACGTTGCKIEIRLPSDATEIGANSFSNSSTSEPENGWTEFTMTLPEAIEVIPGYFFGGCDVTNVVFPKNIKTLSGRSFYYCVRETEFVIPKTLETIYGCAFYYSNFSHITFEEGMVEIPDALAHQEYTGSGGYPTNYYYPFYYTTIGEMTLPSTLNTIGRYFLYYAKGPAKLVLPEGLKNVKNAA